jgi:hypothetical protein
MTSLPGIQRDLSGIARDRRAPAGPRPDLRLDRDIHLEHRFLFHSQTAPPELICAIRSVVIMGVVDRWGYRAMADERLPVRVERSLVLKA